jgi:hypothetical protein
VVRASKPRELTALIADARRLAVEYYALTGRPLGITAEIGECEAQRLLNLKLAPVREAGFDATDRGGRRIQIKSRRIPLGRESVSQRVGSIDIDKPWDVVMLIVMDHGFNPIEIFEANRRLIRREIEKPGSKARNERHSLTVSFFRRKGVRVWPK